MICRMPRCVCGSQRRNTTGVRRVQVNERPAIKRYHTCLSCDRRYQSIVEFDDEETAINEMAD